MLQEIFNITSINNHQIKYCLSERRNDLKPRWHAEYCPKNITPSKNVLTVGAICLFDSESVMPVTQLKYKILYNQEMPKIQE